nr:hypothetical protein BaRGS_021855 [Batillaria attramentaria]
MADKFTTDTTSDGAGGVFVPYAIDTDRNLIRGLGKWGTEGSRHFYQLAFSEHSKDAGVYLSHGYELSTKPLTEGAKRLWEWVGLRPYRGPPKVETELYNTSKGRTMKVVHNYGHGAYGVSLSWGTGVHVAEMVDSLLKARPKL